MWIFTLKTTLSKTETVWTGTKLACSRLSDSLTDSVEDAKVKSTLKVGGAGKKKNARLIYHVETGRVK